LSKDDLKTIRAPVSSPIAFSRFAIARECSRDSMTQGPAKKIGGESPPIV
jgi:hypothetical protein